MPPKKDKKDVKEESKENEMEAALEGLLMEKDLLIEQLQGKVVRLEERTYLLSQQNEKLVSQLDEQKGKLKDISEFLTGEVRYKEKKIAELELALFSLQTAKDEEVAALSASLHEERNAHEKFADEMKLQLDDAEARLREVKEFSDKKSALEDEVARAKAALEKERREHEEAMAEQERHAVQDLDRLKKEMMFKIKETRASMMKLTEDQLDKTTKQTILENEQISTELAYQSNQTERLLQKNEKLMLDNAAMRRSIEIFKETEEELAKRNHMYQKTIKTLLSKIRTQEMGKAEVEAQDAQADLERNQCLLRTSKLESIIEAAAQELGPLRLLVARQQRELEEAAALRSEVTSALNECLEDIPRKKDDSASAAQPRPFNISKLHNTIQSILGRLGSTQSAHGPLSPNESPLKFPCDITSPPSNAWLLRMGSTAPKQVVVEDILALPISDLGLNEPRSPNIATNNNKKPSSPKTTQPISKRTATTAIQTAYEGDPQSPRFTVPDENWPKNKRGEREMTV